MSYSTEYASAIILVLEAILKFFKVELPDGMAVKVVEAGAVMWSFGNLIWKRYQRGGVTILGVRK